MSTLNFDLQFASLNQNMFASGESFNFTDDRFVGIEFDESINAGFTVPIPFIDDIDVGFSAFANAEVGLQSTLELNGGTVNTFLPIDLSLDIPDDPVKEGETITIKSNFSLGSFSLGSIISIPPILPNINIGSFFTTSSPNASYDLDFIFDVAAGLDVNPGTVFDFGFDINETVNLVSFDSANSSAISFNGDLGALNVSIPNVNTVGTETSPEQLTSSGSDEFVNGSLDLDFIATSLFGLPPLEGDVEILDFSIPVPFLPDIDVEAGLNYNLLDIEAAANLSLSQDFSLGDITLPALLTLEDGTTIPFNIGEEIEVTVPNNVGQSLDFETLIDVNALFSNETNIGLDFDLDFLVGEFDLELPFLPDPSFGPLFEESVDLFETSFTVFDDTFNLEGFNQESISFQVEVEAEDEILPTPNDDNLMGGPENDFIDALAGNDTVDGGFGDDTLEGGPGDDLLKGNRDDDLLLGNIGDDRLVGQGGDDTLEGGDGNDRLWGEAGDDLLNGGAGNDRLIGWRGEDTLDGGFGEDTLEGGDDDDLLRGGRDNDLLLGEAGDDRLVGQGGDDTLLGGQGDDRLWGEAGDDSLDGGAGDDFILGWKGDDTIRGGSGYDTFVFAPDHGTDTIADFTVGEDSIGLKDGLAVADLSVSVVNGNTEIATGDETLAILENQSLSAAEIDFISV